MPQRRLSHSRRPSKLAQPSDDANADDADAAAAVLRSQLIQMDAGSATPCGQPAAVLCRLQQFVAGFERSLGLGDMTAAPFRRRSGHGIQQAQNGRLAPASG